MAQLVMHPPLDFGAGHDLGVVGLSLALGSVFSAASPRDSLSLLPTTCVLSLSKNK